MAGSRRSGPLEESPRAFEAAALAAESKPRAYPFCPSASLDLWEWVRVQPRGMPPKARWGHSAVCIGEGMYVMGGDDLTDSDCDILNDLFCYDSTARAWKQCRDAPHGRCWHSATGEEEKASICCPCDPLHVHVGKCMWACACGGEEKAL